MKHLEFSGRVDAPMERAFDLAIDPVQTSQDMPWIQDVRDIHGNGSHVGDSFRFTDHLLGRSVDGMSVVTTAERPIMHTTQTTYDDGTHVIWAMHFVPAPDGEGTDVRSTVWYELPHSLIGRAEELVFGPFIEHRLKEAQARYRARLRARTPQPS
jgi:uncharacterized membrane protein